MKVVLDTNIFISGIFWQGKCNQILELWKQGKFIVIMSSEIIEEIVNVLKDFKIKMPDEMINEWIKLILRNSEIVEITEKFDISNDIKDNIFIETAVSGNADFIVSQDYHLLNLKEFRNIRIINPEEFLAQFG